MKKLISLAALVVSSFVSSAFADTVYVALISGDQEVPARDSPIIGMAVLSVVDNGDGTGTATVVVSTFNVDPKNPIQASHIHRAPAGVNGPIICGLTGAIGEFVNPVVRTCNFDEVDFQALQDGNLYFNAHTPAFPGGESRGQIGLAQ